MICFYPLKIRRTFASSNNDKAIFEMLKQTKIPEGWEIKRQNLVDQTPENF